MRQKLYQRPSPGIEPRTEGIVRPILAHTVAKPIKPQIQAVLCWC